MSEKLQTCKGNNCSCTDGISHSTQCREEHDALVYESATFDHINHGGWKCKYCSYNGQDNTEGNRFCAKCAVHR